MNLKTSTYIITIILSSFALCIMARENINIVEKPWFRNNAFVNNPSAGFQMPVDSLLYVKTGFNKTQADQNMYLVEDGNGFENIYFETTSFKRLNDMTFFGNAKYELNSNKNIRWSNIDNHQMLSPYIVADSVGGNYLREKYGIEGGFSQLIQNFEWGIRGIYHGSVAYRQIDPRPRNTVSELTIQSGFNLRNRYFYWGFAPSFQRYRQSVEINVEKEKKLIYLYSGKGLGLYNLQLSDFFSSYSRNYKSETYALTTFIHWQNNQSKTLIELKNSIMKLQIVESDRRIPFKLRSYNNALELSHEQKINNRTLFLDLKANYHQRIGNETQFKSVQINNIPNAWEAITHSDRYVNHIKNIAFTALYANPQNPDNTMWQQFEFVYCSSIEQYIAPNIEQQIEYLKFEAEWGLNSRFTKNTWDNSLRIKYRPVLNALYTNHESNTLSEQYQMANFRYLQKTLYGVGLSSSYHLKINRNLGVSLSASLDFYMANAYETKRFMRTMLTLYF